LLGVSDAVQTRKFYGDMLGLTLVREELPFGLVFRAGEVFLQTTLVYKVQTLPYTTLGWNVEDIEMTVAKLRNAGVVFERVAGLNGCDEHGIWSAPGGARIAWFRDPDGNRLSISQTNLLVMPHPAAKNIPASRPGDTGLPWRLEA
jgi:catechol 2,3-dioxygenase-like lactoylglutathione lyase family enzyme